MPLIKLANLILLPENNGIFLKYSQFSSLTYIQIMGRWGCFQDAPFSRLWVLGFFPAIHRAVGSCNTAHPASFTTFSTFILPHAERDGVWRDHLGQLLGNQTQLVPVGGDLHLHWALHLLIPHCSIKKLWTNFILQTRNRNWMGL